jgi:AcrR family transcriptional regulator
VTAHPEHTSRRMEEAAVELFFREGYPKTTIREITSALGLTPGAFYNHFRAKEELLYAIVSRTHEGIEAALAEGLAAGGSRPTGQLYGVARALTRFYAHHPMEALISKQDWSRLPQHQQATVLASERRIRAAVEKILADGLGQGEFRITLGDGRPGDVPVAAKAILDQIIGPTAWFRSGGRVSADDLAEQYAVLVLQMVGVPPRRLLNNACRSGP